MSEVINWLDMHKHATTDLDGEHPIVIVETSVTKTNDQSKDMIKFKAKIESGPFVDRPITGNFTISPDSPVAMRILFANWAVLGLDAKFFAANPNASLDQIAQMLVGRRAIGVLSVRTWEGRKFDEIKDWKPALSGPGSTLPLGSGVGGPLSGGLAGAGSSPLASPASASSVPSAPLSSPASAAVVDAEQPKTEAPKLTF